MRYKPRFKVKSWQSLLGVSLLIGLAFPLVSVLTGTAGASTISVVSNGLPEEDSDYFKEQTVSIYTQILDFDPETKQAKVVFYPWPSGDIGKQFSSSVLSDVGVRFFADGLGVNLREFPAGSQIGGVETMVDVLSTEKPAMASDSLYPFDEYTMDSYASVEMEPIEGLGYRPVQTFDYFYESPVTGFDVVYERIGAFENTLGTDNFDQSGSQLLAERAEGKVSFTAHFSRSLAVRNIAIFIYAFAVLSALTLLVATIQMAAGRRRASLDALVWAAVTLPGIIQLRLLAPGEPRLGVVADNLFFLPSLVLMLLCVVVIAYLWSFRDKSVGD